MNATINNEEHNDKKITGQMTYFNVLAISIQRINEAILHNGDSRDAAENFLSDIPTDWKQEVAEPLNAEQLKLQKVDVVLSKYLRPGTNIFRIGLCDADRSYYIVQKMCAEKTYARNIKNIIIDLLQKKGLLYSVKDGVLQGFFETEED